MQVQTSRQISDWWLRQWTTDAKVWYPKGTGPWENPKNPITAGTPDAPYEALTASQAYIITYAIPVLFFVFMMLVRGALHHWYAHGVANNMQRQSVYK